MFRRITLALTVLALTACSPGASTSGSPSGSAALSTQPSGSGPLEKVTLLLGYRPDVQFAPFYLAQSGGYYRDAGLEVSIEFKQSPDVIRLVGDDQAQFGVADATDVMISRTSGIPIKYVSTLYQSFPVSIIGRAGNVPSDPAGLAGKKIGTPGKFGSSWAALLALLKAGGLTEKDVTIREYPQFNQVDGLANGDVDLITGFRNNEPLRLEQQGIAVDQLTIDRIAPLPGPGIIAGDGLLDSNPELVQRFVAATAKAQAAVIDDPQRGMDAAAAEVTAVKEDPQTSLKVLQATAELWKGTGGFAYGRIDLELWQKAYATMKELGFIDGSVPMEEMIWPLGPGPAQSASPS
jgi:NitT/TauT family transport system substrate-binding protein